MSSGDFNYVTLRNLVPSNTDGSFVQPGYVLTVGPDAKQLWTNDVSINNLVASTFFVVSTSRFPQGLFDVIWMSSASGSTMTMQNLQVYSSLTTSSLYIQNTMFENMSGSTLTGAKVIASTLYYSTMFGSTATTSTLSASTLNVSSLFGSSLTTSTLLASTAYVIKENVSTLTVSTLVGTSDVNINNGFYSTLTGYAIQNSSISSNVSFTQVGTTSSLAASTVQFGNANGTNIYVNTYAAANTNINLGKFSTLVGSTMIVGIFTGSSVFYSSMFGSSLVTSTMFGSTIYFSTSVGSTLTANIVNVTALNANNTLYSTLTGSSITTSTLSASTLNYSTMNGSTLTTSSFTVSSMVFSTVTGSTLTTNLLNVTASNTNNGLFSTLKGSTLTASTAVVSSLYYSTVLGSSLTTALLAVQSTATVSTMNATSLTYSTLLGSTMTLNTGFWNSTLTGSTITLNSGNYSTMTGSTIGVNTLNASTLMIVSSGYLGVGITNPTYNFQTSSTYTINLSNNYTQNWVSMWSGNDAGAFTATYNGTMVGPTGSPSAMVVTLGPYVNTVVTYNGSLVPGNSYLVSFTAKMTGSSPYFYICNHLSLAPADQQVPGTVTYSMSGTYATYAVQFTAPSGQFGISFVSQANQVVSFYGFSMQGFYNQMTGALGLGTVPKFSLHAPLGSIQAFNYQRFEWINTQYTNVLGYSPASAPGMYKIATMGAPANSGTYGMVNVRGQMGGFTNTNIMYVDLSIVTRNSISVWGTVGGYQVGSGIIDLVYSVNGSGQYDIYIYIKSNTYVVYDLMVSGASGNNVLYDPATAALVSVGSVTSPQSLSAMATMFQSGAGLIGIGKTSPAYALDVLGTVNVSGTFLVNGSPLSLSGGGSAWTSNGTSLYYNAGNIGIGTSSPSSQLHLFGNNGSTFTTKMTITNGANSNTDFGSAILLNNVNGGTAYNLGQIVALRANSPTDFSSYMAFSSANTLGGLVEAMRILANGYVGIGMTNPAYMLDVAGNIHSAGYVTANNPTNAVLMVISGAGQYSTSAAANDGVIRTTNGNLILQSGTGAAALAINSANNVGIGTTGASYPLVIAGSTVVFGVDNAAAFAAKNSTGTYEQYFWPRYSDNVMYLNAGSAGFNLRSSTSTSMLFVTSAGLVGIATNSPGYLLTITGTNNVFGVDNGAGFVAKNSTGTYETYFYPRYTDNVMYLKYGSAGFNIQNNAGTSTMVMNNSGLVGIATASPGATLDVNGTVQAVTAFQSSSSAAVAGVGTYQTVYLGQSGATAPRGTAVRFGDVLGAAYYVATGTNNFTFYKDVSGGNAAAAMSLMGGSATGATPNVYVNNNLGIGTASPASALHVYNSGITLNNAFSTYGLYLTPITTTGTGSNWSIAGDSVIKQYSGNLMIVTGSTGNQGIYLSSGGNLGIGKSAPGYAVDVVGSLNITGTYYVNGVALTTGGGGSSSQWTTAGSNIYYNTGNVGIGVSFPNYGLHLGKSVISNLGGAMITSNNTIITTIGTTASNSGTLTGPSGGIYTLTIGTGQTSTAFSLATENNMIVGATYTVSIRIQGTVTTNYYLSDNITQSYVVSTTIPSTYTSVSYSFTATNAQLWLGCTGTAGQNIQVQNISITILTPVLYGNVGIGISNPSYLLDVIGTSRLSTPADDTGNPLPSYLYDTFGSVWTQPSATPIATGYWTSTATSYTGQYMSATSTTGTNGTVAVSSNYGSTWTSTAISGDLSHMGISGTGQYQLVSRFVSNGAWYISSDYGITWTVGTTLATGVWSGSAMSYTGQYQYVCQNGGVIYSSSNNGFVFAATSSPNKAYQCIACSADGKHVTAGATSSELYYSSDFGVTWTATTIGTLVRWRSLAMSSSGQYQYGVDDTNHYLYYSSNYGVTWTRQSNTTPSYYGIACSSSGQYVITGNSTFNNYTYVSKDYGATWSVGTVQGAWYKVSMSQNGKYILYMLASGLYISQITTTALITSGNVGIGKTNPAYALDVAGTVNISGSYYVNGAPMSSSQWTTTGSNIYYTTGSVGIGTNNPIQGALQVNGRGIFGYVPSTRGGILIDNETAYGGYPVIQGVTNTLGTNTITINPAGGFVGIGVTNPGSALDVRQVGGPDGVSNGAQIYFPATYNSLVYSTAMVSSFRLKWFSDTWDICGMRGGSVAFQSMGFRYNGTETMTLLTGGNVGIGNTAPSQLLDLTSSSTTPAIRIQSQYSACYLSVGSVVGVNSYIGLQSGASTSSGLGTPPFVVTNANTIGIGTANPNYTLHMYGNANGSVTQCIQNANAGSSVFLQTWLLNDTGTGAGLFLNSSTRSVDGGVNNATLRNDAGDLRVQAKGGVGMQIVSTTGFVGIGTASPLAMLHISNTTASGNGYGLMIVDSPNAGGAGGAITIRNSGGGNNAFASLIFEVDGSTSAAASSTPAAFNQGNGMIYCQNVGGGANNTAKFGFQVWNGTTEAEIMTILPTGYVGINTTSPGYALHVVGTIYASGDVIALSDQRYKQNITPLTNSLAKLQQLSGYTYTRNDLPSNDVHMGLLAQEVLAVFPEAVSYNQTDDKYGLNYNAMVAPLVESIKALSMENKELRYRLNKQESLLQSILERLG